MNGPPSAHNSSHGVNDISGGRLNHKRLLDPSQLQQHHQGINKRPRVRDYVGTRGPSRHLMVDLPQRSLGSGLPDRNAASVNPNFPFSGLNPQQLLTPNVSVPLVKNNHNNTREMSSNSFCDKPKEPSGDDLGAPLDLCIKKPSSSRHDNPIASSSLIPPGARLEDLTRRLSQGSDESLNSYPKKRGRKPKSLLLSGLSSTSSGSNSNLMNPSNASIPSVNDLNRPRKRGRPPLMSPPPNIEMQSSSTAQNRLIANKHSNMNSSPSSNSVDPLAFMSNPALLANFLAQQQQLASQGWPGILGQINPMFMPNAIKDLFTHQLSGLQGQQPQSKASSSLPSTPQASFGSSRQQQMLQQQHLLTTVSQSPATNDSDSGGDDSVDDFKPGTNEEDIRVPIRFGWRRFTIISKVSSSGVKGDVIYSSPEGKKLRTLNEIHKYLNKYHVKKMTRDNFSFSTKWFVGEFSQPSEDNTEHRMLSESEVINRVEELKRAKRKKLCLPNKKKSSSTLNRRQLNQSESPQAGPSRSLSKETVDQRAREEQAVRDHAQQLLQFAQSIRADELKMLEMIQSMQKNNQTNAENERKREEEQKRAQLAAAAARQRELEMKRQQEEQLQKEQELQKRREQQMIAEIERERKRQHMIIVRNMDFHRRLEERERKKEELMAEKRLQQEKKMLKKRLEIELVKELKKPIDDMRLKDLKPLPAFNRIPGLKLPAKAFSDILMVYEFLHSFGETLGFELDSIPTLNSMQLSLLNMDDSSEEALLNILQHLLVCAIEDPGLPVNMTTVMGQKIKDVTINTFNLSEVLRLYFQSFVIHRKSAATGQEGHILKCLAGNKPFLSLCPTLKAEILAYLSNELLCNQAIVKQLEENIETVTSLRKDKWIVDCDLRKFKGIKAKREKKAEEANKEKEEKEKQDKEAEHEELDDKETTKDKDDEVIPKKIEEDSDHESGGEDNPPPINLNDEEVEMSNEEVDKKIDKLSRQCTLLTNKLNKAVNGVRVTPLGQDRYRRRFWALPASGGVFVEGMESGEPEELINNEGDEEDSDDMINGEESESQSMDPQDSRDVTTAEVAANGDSPALEVKVNGIVKDSEDNTEDTKTDSQDASLKTEKEVLENGEDESMSTNMMEIDSVSGKEATPEKLEVKGLPFPLVNHIKEENKSWFSLLPREPCSATIVDLIPKPPEEPIEDGICDSQDSKTIDTKPDIEPQETVIKTVQDALNILAAGGCIDISILSTMEELGEMCPSLQKKLQEQSREQFEEAKKIPADYQFGWWSLSDVSQLRGLLDLLHERGVRERLLLKHIQKYMPYITMKIKANEAEFDVTDLDRKIFEECSFGAPRDSGRYSREVALRLDVAVIEEIETLEDKISNSSMQVRGWKPSVKVANDPNITFTRKLAIVEDSLIPNGDIDTCEQEEEEEDSEEDHVDALSFAKERLLSTEAMIERRYLKPPLGFKSNTIVVSSGIVDELAENAADENAPSGLLRWRDAVRECLTTSQLALLVNFLESCIAWDKSIMRASCQFCTSGENEEQLLLCDGCDKGYHMYCFKPKMETVPDGDWFCFECQNKNTIDKVCIVCGKKGKLLSCETCPKVFHPNCVDPPVSKPPKGKWSCHVCLRKPKKMSKTMPRRSATSSFISSDNKSPVKEDKTASQTPNNTPKDSKKTASASKAKKEKTKILKEDKEEVKSNSKKKEMVKEEVEKEEEVEEKEPKLGKKKTKEPKENHKVKEDQGWTISCSIILEEMTKHQHSWPFKQPVNLKKFPTYKKVVKRPMDLQTMKKSLESGIYKSRSDFWEDALTIFENCKAFNEDDSPVGKSGFALRDFLEKRWKELFNEQRP